MILILLFNYKFHWSFIRKIYTYWVKIFTLLINHAKMHINFTAESATTLFSYNTIVRGTPPFAWLYDATFIIRPSLAVYIFKKLPDSLCPGYYFPTDYAAAAIVSVMSNDLQRLLLRFLKYKSYPDWYNVGWFRRPLKWVLWLKNKPIWNLTAY